MQDKGWGNDFISKLKSSVNIVNVVSRYVPLTKKGRTYWGCCPFHHEKTPSFAVNDVEQFYHCFGCGESGDVISFVQKIEGADFTHVVNSLAESVNLEVPKFTGDEEILKRKKEKDKLINICTDAAKYYHNELSKPSAEIAVSYLKQRQINNQTVESMLLGYSGDWQGVINHLKKLGYSESDIKKSGIVGEKNGRIFDAMMNRLVFPIYNHQGKIVGFSGRALLADAFAKYKNTEETEIFRKSFILYGINNLRKARVEDKNYAIMVEGQIDVVSLYQAGFKNAIASLGTAFNQNHLETISKFVDSIYICFDGDSAGIKATERSIELLKNTNFDVKVIMLPDKLDPDEYLKKYGKEGFEKQIKNAIPVKEFEINRLYEKYDLTDKTNVPKFIEASINLISTFKDVTERDIYLKLVAKKANMNEEILRRELNKKVLAMQNKNLVDKKPVLKVNKLEQAERFVLACKMFKKPYCKNLSSNLFENSFYAMFNQYLIDNNPKVSNVLDDFDVENNEYIKNIIYFDFNQIKEEEKHYLGCVKQLELRQLLKKQTELQISLQTANEDQKIIILNELQKIIKEIQTKKVED